MGNVEYITSNVWGETFVMRVCQFLKYSKNTRILIVNKMLEIEEQHV